MARPTIMTTVVIAKLEEAFAWGCSDKEACLWAEIAPATLYKYQDRHPEFVERKESLKENPILLARQSVLKGVRKNPDLALKFLERKKKDEFSLRSEVTGAEGQPLTVIVEDLYGNKPTFRTNSVSEADDVAEDSSSTSS